MSGPDSGQAVAPRAPGRLAAVLEVLGVYTAGVLVMSWLTRLLGIQLSNPLPGFTVNITNEELLAGAGQLAVLLLLQYAGWFLLIVPINAWHRRRGPAAYGLTRGGFSWRALLVAGLATAALCEWPALTVSLLDEAYDLGETVPWRQAIFDTSWRRWEFWVFSGILSWGVVAVFEELFFRGYCQRRLAEDWGDGAAIAGTSCLFVFAHGQYFILNAYNLGMIFSLLCISVGFGVVYAWTRSLVPSVVAHAIINTPMTPFWQAVCLLAFLVGVLFCLRPASRITRQVLATSSIATCVVLALLGAGWSSTATRVEGVKIVGGAMVLAAVGLHVLERRRPRRTDDLPPPAPVPIAPPAVQDSRRP